MVAAGVLLLSIIILCTWCVYFRKTMERQEIFVQAVKDFKIEVSGDIDVIRASNVEQAGFQDEPEMNLDQIDKVQEYDTSDVITNKNLHKRKMAKFIENSRELGESKDALKADEPIYIDSICVELSLEKSPRDLEND